MPLTILRAIPEYFLMGNRHRALVTAGSSSKILPRQLKQFSESEGNKHLLGYSGSIMTDQHLPASSAAPIDSITPLDPIAFTRQLCEIESTTYHEGAVGDFLADFLAGRGWAVEKTLVEQPSENPGGGPRWNVYAGGPGETPDLVFSTHMDTVPPYIPLD